MGIKESVSGGGVGGGGVTGALAYEIPHDRRSPLGGDEMGITSRAGTAWGWGAVTCGDGEGAASPKPVASSWLTALDRDRMNRCFCQVSRAAAMEGSSCNETLTRLSMMALR